MYNVSDTEHVGVHSVARRWQDEETSGLVRFNQKSILLFRMMDSIDQ